MISICYCMQISLPLAFCTIVVYLGATGRGYRMPETKRGRGKAKEAQMPRTSVSFPPELHKTIEDLAKRKKVSMAWIVREAVEKYVADQWPLLSLLREE